MVTTGGVAQAANLMKTHHARNAAVAKASIATPRHNSLRTIIEPRSQDESIRVVSRRRISGGGMMALQTIPKSRSGVSQEYISKQTPTLNPSYLVGALPGVQTSNEGPLVTSGETMHIRGLDQSQIGYLYEGVPLSDPFAYLIYTELAADNENIASVTVTQGSTDLTAPLHNADGAQISMTEMRPSDKSGGYTDASGGKESPTW